MPDPITVGAIALNVGCGIGGNAMQALGIGGYRRVADILSRGTADENHDILKATHIAHVEAMEVMAAYCLDRALGKEEKAKAKALKALVKRRDFREFRFDGEHFPLAEANAAIDRMFASGIGASGGGEDEHRAYNQVIVDDLAVWGLSLPPGLTALFVDGLGGEGPWHLVFRTAFAEQVKKNQTAFRILTWERLGELRAMGIAVLDQFAVLHGRFDVVEAMLREVLANQGSGSERASIELLQSLADGYAEAHPDDLKGLKNYLLQKIEEWRVYRARIEAIESEGNRDTALLADAQAATDRGDFPRADALLAEAEGAIDDKIEPLLNAKSVRRMLRGDNARLSGDYRTAIEFYDEAVMLLPESACDERIARRWTAASAMYEWADRLGEPTAPLQAVERWRQLALELKLEDDPRKWIQLQNNLGRSLSALGGQHGNLANLRAAVDAHRAALEECDSLKFQSDWVWTHLLLGQALWQLGRREASVNSLDQAVETYTRLLDVLAFETTPAEWAQAQYGLSVCFMYLGLRTDRADDQRRAVDALIATLTVWTFEEYPDLWAMSQQSLGIALKNLGKHEQPIENFEASIEAYQRALKVVIRERGPLSWAGLQDDLGNVLSLLGEQTKIPAHFDQAIAAHNASLEVRVRDKLPLPWALTKENLASSLMCKARAFNCGATARAAVEAAQDAVDGLAGLDMTWNEDKARDNLEAARLLSQTLSD